MDLTRWHMDEEGVTAHLALLSRIGIGDRDVEIVESMMRGAMSSNNYAVHESLVPLLPVDLSIMMLEMEKHMISVRPHLWGIEKRTWLLQRSTLAGMGAIIMDMRATSGDPEALRGAVAMREFTKFIDELELKWN